MAAINFSKHGKGKAWLRDLPPAERQQFGALGLHYAVEKHGNWWGIGGKARAATAVRIKGRFAPKAKPNGG